MRIRLLIVAFLLGACGALEMMTPTPELPTSTPTTEPDLRSTVRVLGSLRSVNVTFRLNGATERYEGVRLPWEHEFLVDVDDLVQVFAYSNNGGRMACEWEIERAAGLIDHAEAGPSDTTSVSCGGIWVGFTYD